MAKGAKIEIIDVDTMQIIDIPAVNTDYRDLNNHRWLMYSSATHIYSDLKRYKVHIRELSGDELTLYVREEKDLKIG